MRELGQVYRYATPAQDGLQFDHLLQRDDRSFARQTLRPDVQMPASFTARFGPVDEVEPIIIHMDGGSSRPLIMDPQPDGRPRL